MSKILVLDKSPRFRHLIADGLRQAGHEIVPASDVAAGMALIKIQHPDLVLLDADMPGMEDLRFLRTIRSNPSFAATSVILLAAHADRHQVVQAAALGVRDYLLKSKFPVEGMVERVLRVVGKLAGGNTTQRGEVAVPPGACTPAAGTSAIASALGPGSKSELARPIAHPSDLPALMEKDECLRRAQKAMEGRTLSGAVAQVMALAGSSKSDIAQLAALIARDSVLSVRVLQAANSPAYATKRGVVSTLLEAVRNIGCATVRNIAATVGVFDAMPPTCADGFNPIRCWQHSFAVARLCEMLVSSIDSEQAGVAYLVGLCHDLAEILFHTQFGPEHKQIIDAEARTGLPRDQIERQMLGATHAELVRTIMSSIGLPEAIRRPVEALHARRKQMPEDPLAAALFIADAYAIGMTLAASPAAPATPLLRSVCQKAAGAPDPPVPEPDAFCAEIFGLTGLLARLRPEEEAEFLRPLFARCEKHLCLASEPAFSKFDPIAAALRAMCDVKAIDHLPEPGELSEISGMVVVTRSTAAPKFSPADVLRRVPTGNGAPLPILWFTTECSNPVDSDIIQHVSASVPLVRLAEFVDGIPMARSIAA